MEEQLSLEFLRVVENGAIAAARTMGFGDRHKADEVAVEAMRKTMDQVEMDGTIVIGEGERDEAPMLYIGEKVGLAQHAPKSLFPSVDIAVDPLEGTNLCATGLDTIPLPGDTTVEELARIIGDVATLSVKWNKPLSARLLPVKDKHAGEMTEFTDPFLINGLIRPLPGKEQVQ